MYITVVIPAYNKAAYIVETLRSVAAQTYHKVEIIVVDDASTDDTATILANIKDIPNLNVITKHENKGLCAALNTGIEYASGRYVMILDADDTLVPHCIATLVRHLRAYPRCGAVYSNCEYVTDSGELIPSRPKKREFNKAYVVRDKDEIIRRFGRLPGSGTLFRKDALDNVQRFDSRISVQDNQIALKLAVSKWEIHKVTQKLWAYRQVPGAMHSRANDDRQLVANLAACDYVAGHPLYWQCRRQAVLFGARVSTKATARRAILAIPLRHWNLKLLRLLARTF